MKTELYFIVAEMSEFVHMIVFMSAKSMNSCQKLIPSYDHVYIFLIWFVFVLENLYLQKYNVSRYTVLFQWKCCCI